MTVFFRDAAGRARRVAIAKYKSWHAYALRLGAMFCFAALSALASIRIVLAVWQNRYTAGPWLIVLAVSAYAVFLFEGLAVSSGRLREVDAEVVLRHATFKYPRRATRICDAADLVRGPRYAEFLVGQQLVSILLVIFVASALDKLASLAVLVCATPVSCGVGWMPSAAWPKFAWLARAAVSDAVTFLVSTFLICWLFQLTPALLAEGCEAGFLQLPLTRFVLRLGGLAAHLQIGHPGRACANWLRKRRFFIHEDELGLSG